MKLRDLLEAERRGENAAFYAERLADWREGDGGHIDGERWVGIDGLMPQAQRRHWKRSTAMPVVFYDMREKCGCFGKVGADGRHCINGGLHFPADYQ